MYMQNRWIRAAMAAVAAGGLSVVAAACGSSSTATSSANSKSGGLQSVVIESDGVPSAPFAAFAYGQAAGIYKQHGLTVQQIYAGSDSGALAALERGDADFAMLEPGTLLQAVRLGARVEAIMSPQPGNSTGLVTRKSSGIVKASQLKGKTLGVIDNPSSLLQTKEFLQLGGLSPSEYTIQPLSVAAVNSAFLDGKTDAAEAGLFALPPLFANKGIAVNSLSFAKAGISGITFIVATRTSLAKSDPSMVKNFVAGTVAALKASNVNPTAAAKATISAAAGGTAPPLSVMISQIKLYAPFEKSSNGSGSPLGWMAEADWQASLSQGVKAGELPASTSLKDAYTNQFIPGS